MKLRLSSDSIRIRLRQGEVRHLAEVGWVETRVALANGTLICSLRLLEGPAEASLSERHLALCIPSAEGKCWAASTEVGLVYTLASGTRLLVEKDFACLEPREGETNADTFPRPHGDGAPCRGNE